MRRYEMAIERGFEIFDFNLYSDPRPGRRNLLAHLRVSLTTRGVIKRGMRAEEDKSAQIFYFTAKILYLLG